jgi:S1-C subfamily serine protease
MTDPYDPDPTLQPPDPTGPPAPEPTAVAGGQPASGAGGTDPQTPPIAPTTEPTMPGGWPASSPTPGAWPGANPTTPGGWPGGGWSAPGGWTPTGPTWHQPGAGGGGWVPPGAGWVPPGGGWSPSPRGRNRWTAGLVALALVALLVGAGALGYVVRSPGTPAVSTGLPFRTRTSTSRTSTTSSTSTTSNTSSGSNSASGSPPNASAVAAAVDPGLVDINTTLKDEDEEAAGTGMVLTSNGEVLTNNHVIEGATTISVTDLGNGKTYGASVVGYDRTEDMAVLQLQGASGLKTVSIGKSATVIKGEGVIGIGNAGGVGGTPSVAGGSVTALGQSITASDAGDGTSEKLTDLIETNCDIQPGDSGGPLVNSSGKVVGMDTAASEGVGGGGFSFRTSTGQTASSQGYSIPIDEAITLAKKIVANQASTTIHIGKTAFLGVQVTGTGTTTTSGSFGRLGFGTTGATTAAPSTATAKGAHIAGVISGQPAVAAGLAKGDVITEFGGKTVTSATALTSIIEGYHPGQRVKWTWVNTSGQKQSATVTLATGPAA